MVTLILINSYFRVYVLGVIALLGSGFKCPGDHRLHVGKRRKKQQTFVRRCALLCHEWCGHSGFRQVGGTVKPAGQEKEGQKKVVRSCVSLGGGNLVHTSVG